MPKSAKSAPKFFFKKRHNFGQRRHNLRHFLFGMKLKMTHHAIFIAFLCDNFSQISNSNVFPRFFNTSTGKSLFFKIFLPAPNIFWRHKEFQNSHSGAKAPLLTTLLLTDINRVTQMALRIKIFPNNAKINKMKWLNFNSKHLGTFWLL